ncbi:MAG: ABC transporter permease subunit, partial [Sandaracinaceae bacterium]
MRRIAGLLSKEVWHHAGVLVLVGLFVGVVQGILLLGALVGPRTITMLEPHATFMRVFLPLLALALGHRLVVREYYAKTQRFLEALPVHRLEVLAVKLVLGLVVLGVAVTLSLTCAAALAAVKEPLTGWWLILIFVRSQVFALTIWSVFFGMGLLGRWRVPIYLAGGLTLTFLDQGTAFDVSRFGPFALVGERIVLERLSMPWVEIGVSLAIAAFMIALGVILGLVDEGSVAESLAKPMSRRERIAVGVVLALALIAWEAVDPKPDVAAFAFSGDTVVRRDGLSILYLEPAHQSEAEALADAIAPDLAHLRRALGYEAVGPVHVASFPALAANEREAVALDEPEDGVLVRADFTDAAFDRDAFRAWLLERVIEHATDGRAAFEPDAWVAVGSAALLAHAPPDLALAAFYRRARRPRYEALERAFRTEERFGPEVFRALAASAAVAFVDAHGEDAWWAFAREVLAPPAPGVFAMLGPSTRERLEARVDLGAFEASWAARLDA